jgi:hypothetical protein
MSREVPPPIATWLLEHLAPGERNDALAGDLCEEFHSGRSPAWYWRQVLSAIALGYARQFSRQRGVLLFSAMWATLAPAWVLSAATLERHLHLNTRFWQMSWPWSSICDAGWLLAANLLFIWMGILIYLVPHLLLSHRLHIGAMVRAIAASIPVLTVMLATLILLPKAFLSIEPANGHPLLQTTSALQPDAPYRANAWGAVPSTFAGQVYDENLVERAVSDVRLTALALRLPFFLCVLATLWQAAPEQHDPHDRFVE